jgi:signal recognition particle receptor subunit alpha
VVFVGINGVGKSTSLAKVCYYLKSHGLSVSPRDYEDMMSS